MKNYKQGVAKNLQLQIITLKQRHGEMILNGFLPSDTNKYNLIPAGGIYSYFMNYKVRNINLNDSNLI